MKMQDWKVRQHNTVAETVALKCDNKIETLENAD